MHDRQTVAHLARSIAARVDVTKTELTGIVEAPALHGVVVENRARVCGTRGDGLCGAAGAEVDGGKRVVHRTCRTSDVERRPAGELAVVPATKALDAAVIEQRAGVILSGRHGAHTAPGAQSHGSEQVAHLVGSVTECRSAARTDLAGGVRTEALQCRVVQHHAGVHLAGVDVASEGCDLSRRPIRLGRRRAGRICRHPRHDEGARERDDRGEHDERTNSNQHGRRR